MLNWRQVFHLGRHSVPDYSQNFNHKATCKFCVLLHFCKKLAPALYVLMLLTSNRVKQIVDVEFSPLKAPIEESWRVILQYSKKLCYFKVDPTCSSVVDLLRFFRSKNLFIHLFRTCTTNVNSFCVESSFWRASSTQSPLRLAWWQLSPSRSAQWARHTSWIWYGRGLVCEDKARSTIDPDVLKYKMFNTQTAVSVFFNSCNMNSADFFVQRPTEIFH